ncbi:MAG: hypothetical protein Q3Y08_10150, partial [Butyricicoccus sp.]|nr:hypothetical protein [Butyricicoccus sp.]
AEKEPHVGPNGTQETQEKKGGERGLSCFGFFYPKKKRNEVLCTSFLVYGKKDDRTVLPGSDT